MTGPHLNDNGDMVDQEGTVLAPVHLNEAFRLVIVASRVKLPLFHISSISTKCCRLRYKNYCICSLMITHLPKINFLKTYWMSHWKHSDFTRIHNSQSKLCKPPPSGLTSGLQRLANENVLWHLPLNYCKPAGIKCKVSIIMVYGDDKHQTPKNGVP